MRDWRKHDRLEPARSLHIADRPEDEYPFLWEGLECARCRDGIGESWIGGNPDGSDVTEFIPFWRDFHPDGAYREHGYHMPRISDYYYDVFCEGCHDILTAPPRPIPDRVVGEPEDWQPVVGGWIIVHTRATDRVYFGPFATLKELDEWMEETGIDRGVSGSIIPLVSPASNPANIWHDPIIEDQIKIVQPETVDTNA